MQPTAFKMADYRDKDLRCARVSGQIKASVLASIVILVLILFFFSAGGLISELLNLSKSLKLPIAVRIVGILVIGIAATLLRWLMKYRKPEEMIVSTYFTFVKMFKGGSINEKSGRSESLVIQGPQKVVRHPLYLGALLAFLGWAILTNSTSNLLATLVALIWYVIFQIPFEEKELHALFGDQYAEYARNTPMLLPFSKHGKD